LVLPDPLSSTQKLAFSRASLKAVAE